MYERRTAYRREGRDAYAGNESVTLACTRPGLLDSFFACKVHDTSLNVTIYVIHISVETRLTHVLISSVTFQLFHLIE